MTYCDSLESYWKQDGGTFDLPIPVLLWLTLLLAIAGATCLLYGFQIQNKVLGALVALAGAFWTAGSIEFAGLTLYKYDVVQFRRSIARINRLDLRRLVR